MQAAKPLGDRRVIIAHDISVPDAERRWVEPLRLGWPGHVERPSLTSMGLYELTEALQDALPHDARDVADGDMGGVRTTPVADAVIVIAGRSVPTTQLYQLADQLDRSLTPAVIVLDGRSEHDFAALAKGGLRSDGVLVEPETVSPGHVASAAVALLQRQPVLERLVDEMRLSRLGQRQIHAELDRVHRELYDAARLQHEFVRCATPYTPGVEFGIMYRPATYVSGDIFDIEQLDEHRIGIFLADAVGHGVPAGMLTLFISRSLPKRDGFGGSMRIVPPGEALARLNMAYCVRATQNARFATAVYAVLDRRTMKARVSMAGHPPPLVTRLSGEVERLEPGGPLLGIFPDAEFSEVEVSLAHGASMIMYTDGFEVAYPSTGKDAAEPLSLVSQRHLARLVTLGRSAGDRDALASAIASLQVELDAQVGSLHQADDVTAIVIAPTAASATARAAA